MGETRTEWHGSNPYCLVVSERGGGVTLIDLDEPGWVKAHADLMRAEGQWILARKKGSEPVFTILVNEGEQPYYTSRVFTSLLPPQDWFTREAITIDPSSIKEMAQVRAYGIGKKRLDNHVERLWILPNGVICAGDDVDVLGHDLAKASLMRVIDTLRQIDQRMEELHGGDRGKGQQGRGEEGSDHQGQAGEDRRAGRRGDSGSSVRLPARPEAAHRRAQQRTSPRAVASPRRPRGRREAGGGGH